MFKTITIHLPDCKDSIRESQRSDDTDDNDRIVNNDSFHLSISTPPALLLDCNIPLVIVLTSVSDSDDA